MKLSNSTIELKVLIEDIKFTKFYTIEKLFDTLVYFILTYNMLFKI